MSEESEVGVEQSKSYYQILKEAAYPDIYAVAGLAFSFPWTTYTAVLIHLHVTPVFSGEMAAAIATEPESMYLLNAVLYFIFSMSAFGLYQRAK